MMEVQTMEAQASHHHISPSPSFSSYSSETLAEIAARVIQELRRDPHSVSDDETLFIDSWENDDNVTPQDHHPHDSAQNDDVDAADETDDDFEFSFVSRDPNSSPVSADDIFYNGQIRPMYPIFDRNLLFGDAGFAPIPLNDGVVLNSSIPNANDEARRRRLPLRKLMFEERETASCSSSTSETEENSSIELEGVDAESYCVWNPKSAVAADSMGRHRKKSNSTGSASKRWKLRELLLRSHSEGKDPKLLQKRTNKVAQDVSKHPSADKDGGAAVEHDGQKRKSFLPYRQELVGLFSNVNGLGRNFVPILKPN